MLETFYEKLSGIHGKKKWKKFFKFLRTHFGEENPGDLNFDFDNRISRIELVQKVIDKKNFNTYLEIGTFKDELFSKINCKTKVGVDPFSGGNVRMKSDDFFLQNKQNFDCIFIDGLHHYYQVLKDINNSLNVLNENGIIFVHDCLPKSRDAQSIPRTEANWNGDVWKAFVNKRSDPNLDCYTCYADQGIGSILKRSNRNALKLSIKNFKKMKYVDFYKNHKTYMNIIEFDDFIKMI